MDSYIKELISVFHKYDSHINYDTPYVRYHLEHLLYLLYSKKNISSNIKYILHLQCIFKESFSKVNVTECLNEIKALNISNALCSERNNNNMEINLNKENVSQITGFLFSVVH